MRIVVVLLALVSSCVSVEEQYKTAYACARKALPGVAIKNLTCNVLRGGNYSCTAVLDNGNVATVQVNGFQGCK